MEKGKIGELIIEFIKNKNIQESVINSLENLNYNEKYVYNESSFKHELGQYLRKKLKKYNCMVQYERNIKELIGSQDFKINYDEAKKIIKHEMDLLIIENGTNYYSVELKYHKKNRKTKNGTIIFGETPDFMYHCVEDLRFTYDLKHKLKFKETYCVTVIEDEAFYIAKRKNSKSGIYQYFRGGPILEKERVYLQRNDKKKRGEGISIKEFSNVFPVKWEIIRKNSDERYYLIKF